MEDGIVDALRQNMWRRTEAEEQRFLAAVDSINAPVSRKIVEALFDSFLPIDDFGTQESVVGKLCIVSEQDYFDVLGDKIVNLVDRAPDWAEGIIIGAAIYKRPQLVRMLLSRQADVRNVVLSFMKERRSDIFEVRQVIEELETKLC